MIEVIFLHISLICTVILFAIICYVFFRCICIDYPTR